MRREVSILVEDVAGSLEKIVAPVLGAAQIMRAFGVVSGDSANRVQSLLVNLDVLRRRGVQLGKGVKSLSEIWKDATSDHKQFGETLDAVEEGVETYRSTMGRTAETADADSDEPGWVAIHRAVGLLEHLLDRYRLSVVQLRTKIPVTRS